MRAENCKLKGFEGRRGSLQTSLTTRACSGGQFARSFPSELTTRGSPMATCLPRCASQKPAGEPDRTRVEQNEERCERHRRHVEQEECYQPPDPEHDANGSRQGERSQNPA